MQWNRQSNFQIVFYHYKSVEENSYLLCINRERDGGRYEKGNLRVDFTGEGDRKEEVGGRRKLAVNFADVKKLRRQKNGK